MTRERRKASPEISSEVVEYVLQTRGLTAQQLADALEVSAAFISRVRQRERSLTVEHLQAIESLMKVPLGALLLAAVKLPPVTPSTAKLRALAVRAIEQADRLNESARKRMDTPLTRG